MIKSENFQVLSMDEQYEEDFQHKQHALSRCLQQRRSREVLAEQGIMPPIKSPGTYFPQVQRLERARKEDYLNHAIQVRPERDILVQKHILEDTTISNSIVASQKHLQKAKLVDDLNDKISVRPGVFELVERNIIPANDDVQEAIKGGHLQYKKTYDFTEEDSSDALSPEQVPPPAASSPLFQLTTSTVPLCTSTILSASGFNTKNDALGLTRSPNGSSLFTQNSNHPYLSRQTSKGSKMGQSGLMPRVMNARKKKDKPKIKKYRYHQYVPPNQQGKGNEKKAPLVEEDTPYSRLLQQQQMYLQLQIMNNQYSNQMNNQRSADAQLASMGQQSMVSPPPAPPMTQTMKVEKPRNLNAPLTENKLDEMKVSELKEELKLRGQKVTGTKEVLIDRLKPFCVKRDMFMPNLPIVENGNSNFSMISAGAMVPEILSKPPETARLSTTVFQFPTASHTARKQPRTSLSNPTPNTIHHHQQEVNPLNYDQTFGMFDRNRTGQPPGDNGEMNDLLEILNDTTEMQGSPVVTRVLLNDHNSYHGITDRTTSLPQNAYPHHADYIDHEQAQLQCEVRQNQLNKLAQNYSTNGSEYPVRRRRMPYRTKILVDSAGDALMDTSNFPPVINRYSDPLLDQHTIEYSKSSARNSIDSGVMYSTPHFSPMDTNMDSGSREVLHGSRELLNDLRLSTSSLDSGEPTLNAVSLSPATPPRLRHAHSVHPYKYRSSPRAVSLVKSASQELLSSNASPSSHNNPMNNELGWLDLTLGSAVGCPPSPSGPFETVALGERVMQYPQHSNPTSIHGSRDADLNFYPGSMSYPPNANTLDSQWDTSWEGLLNSNFNS